MAVSESEGILLERHGHVEAATAVIEEASRRARETAFLHPHGAVLDGFTALGSKRRVDGGGTALLDRIAEYRVFVDLAHTRVKPRPASHDP